METTIDGLLDLRVTLEQPVEGYRVAIDTVLLAASVPALAGERVLELGCGVGGVLFCLAARVPGVRLTGLEIDENLAELGRKNSARNLFAVDMKILTGDATIPRPTFVGQFDHVLMNPPYHEERRHVVSEDAQKRRANTEKTGDLQKWLVSATDALRPTGSLTLIHRADREKEILGYLTGQFGAVEICAIRPKEKTLPKRVIIRAYKGATLDIVNRTDFILHAADGSFTPATESILRHAGPMPI